MLRVHPCAPPVPHPAHATPMSPRTNPAVQSHRSERASRACSWRWWGGLGTAGSNDCDTCRDQILTDRAGGNVPVSAISEHDQQDGRAAADPEHPKADPDRHELVDHFQERHLLGTVSGSGAVEVIVLRTSVMVVRAAGQGRRVSKITGVPPLQRRFGLWWSATISPHSCSSSRLRHRLGRSKRWKGTTNVPTSKL